SFDEWRDYGVASDDYEGPLIFDDDQFEYELEMGDDAFVLTGKEVALNSQIPEAIMSPGEHEELHRQVEEFVFNGHLRKIMSTCAQPRRPLDLMSLLVSGSVPKKVQDFVEGLPYHGDSFDDDFVGNLRTNFVYPCGNDEGPSIEERALLFLEVQDRVKEKA
nr:putative reverse transcriptase domain-containing protein [Tanacetum cinerariifolium]